MNCRKVSHLLSAYIDGELPGVESLQIRDHLSRCSDCGTEYDDLLSMKRMVGRLKVQEPAVDIAAEILQCVRIEADLRAERSPLAQWNKWVEKLRTAIAFPRVIGLGFGVAAVAALLYSQSISDNRVQVIGEWDHSVPPASAFTSGVQYPNSNMFISPVYGRGAPGNGIRDVSLESNFPGTRETPTPFSVTAGYYGAHN